MPRFAVEAIIECETLEQADRVAVERLGHDEDYGFEYSIEVDTPTTIQEVSKQ